MSAPHAGGFVYSVASQRDADWQVVVEQEAIHGSKATEYAKK